MIPSTIPDEYGVFNKEFSIQKDPEIKDRNLENFLDEKLKEIHQQIEGVIEEATKKRIEILEQAERELNEYNKSQSSQYDTFKELAHIGKALLESAQDKPVQVQGLREVAISKEEKLKMIEEMENLKRQKMIEKTIYIPDKKPVQKKMSAKELKQKKKQEKRELVEIIKKFKNEGRIKKNEDLRRNIHKQAIEQTLFEKN